MWSRKPGSTDSIAWFKAAPGSGWQDMNQTLTDRVTDFGDDNCAQPECYLDLKAAGLFQPALAYQVWPTVVGRQRSGVDAWSAVGASPEIWTGPASRRLSWWPPNPVAPFSDIAGRDCQFNNAPGDQTLPGNTDCLSSSPS